MHDLRSVAVIGAGPVGLAAAAHLLERGLHPTVLEAGPNIGHAVQQWAHVQLFSPWSFNIDKAAGRLLAQTAWKVPDPDVYPTGGELLETYLRPLADHTPLKEYIRTSSKVTAVSRVGFDKVKTRGREEAPFEIRYEDRGIPRTLLVGAVVDVSGTWSSPNPAGLNGLPAAGEVSAAPHVRYGMPDVLGHDRLRYAGRTVAVLGAGHSALGTLIDLVRLAGEVPQTVVIWLLRGTDPSKSFGGGVDDGLSARGELGQVFSRVISEGKVRVETSFGVTDLGVEDGRLRIKARSIDRERHMVVDELVVATGFRPELGMLSELRLSLDAALECPPALAPLIDPNEHSCGNVRPHGARELSQPEPGLYIAGMKSYGRAPTFLMMTGYEQVRSIAAKLAGDHHAAERVELVLPETGVCSGPRPSQGRELVQIGPCCADEAEAPNLSSFDRQGAVRR